MKHLVVVFVVCLGVVVNGSAATFYVDRQRPDDSGAATDWSSAKRSIQAAIDIAKAGDTVLVRPGVYDEGSTVSPNHAHSNRIVCTKDITIESTDGAEATIIMGRRDLADPGTYHGLGPDALRCVYMSVGRLKGFTLTGGATRDDTAESDLCRAGGASFA